MTGVGLRAHCMSARAVLASLLVSACASGVSPQPAPPATAVVPAREIASPRSGVTFNSADVQRLQADDAGNPGMLWVAQGEQLWNERAGTSEKSCANCHGDGALSMRGVAARYPVFDAGENNLVDVEARINQCRVRRQGAEALKYESEPMLALTTYVANQSRGMPVAASIDGPARAHFEAGRQNYVTRQGQLNLSCAQCHDDNWGKRLAGSVIPQAHPTGYPIYRLEWEALGSLERRLRNCMVGVRAEPTTYGAQELVELELFLMWRARGMRLETPAVRP